MPASDYTANNVMAALYDGVPLPIPEGTWIALHTADPGTTGLNEVSTITWPAYVRREVTEWSETGVGERKNAHQVTYTSHDGLDDITLTHWSVRDAMEGGNVLNSGALKTPRLQKTGDIFVLDTNAVTTRLR